MNEINNVQLAVIISILMGIAFFIGLIRGIVVADRQWRLRCRHVPTVHFEYKKYTVGYRCKKCGEFPLPIEFNIKDIKNG